MDRFPDPQPATCPRCGQPAFGPGGTCAACGVVFAGRPAGTIDAGVTMLASSPSSAPADDGDVTLVSPRRPSSSVTGGMTVLGQWGAGGPADIADATFVAPPPRPPVSPDEEETHIAPPRPMAPPDDGMTRISASSSRGGATRFTSAGSTRLRRNAAPSAADTGPLAVGDHFGRYTIVRLLGIGGMGAVYQAWDTELDIVVALKVIRPEVRSDPEAEAEIERRFKRELLLARKVTHRNVVRIHDIGELDGIKYITMTYVDGIELGTLLKQQGRLAPAKALKIIRSVVSGLVAAHEAGVVHRDLKPANVMIGVDGEALIMDFGIARSTAGPAAAAGAQAVAVAGLPAEAIRALAAQADATMAGTIVGTVEYMAPEQARGEAVDQRADVYATGLILYDMLVGERRAVRAGTALDDLRSRMEKAPTPIRTLVPDVPEALAAVIARAVEPSADKRFQSTAELSQALAKLDEKGERLPVKRVLGLPLVAAVILLVVALAGATVYFTRQPPLPKQHAPVSVLIADVQNQTGDPAFDRTLEPMLRRALEGAGFISAYDRNGIARLLGAKPPEKLDEVTGREFAVKQGLGFIVSGTIEKQGSGYGISLKTTETVSGKVIASDKARAATKDAVLGKTTGLVTTVRTALGDDTSESAQMFAMASLSATSLDVVRLYAASQEAASNNRFDEALDSAKKAVELDPKFGIGYQLLSVASRNVGRQEDAQKYINEALRYLDNMTERERYLTRGMYYRVSGDYQQCVKEYGELIGRYAADVTGHNQLALCASQLRDMNRAVGEMRKVVELLPNRAVFRDNLVLYANYAGDFPTAEKEVGAIAEPDAYALLGLAFAQEGQGRLDEAKATFQKLAGKSRLGASFAASGLGDLAAYEARYSDAVNLFETGAAADLAANSPDRAAAKYAAEARVQVLRGHNAQGVAAARKALERSKSVKIRFLAARVLVEAGQPASARVLQSDLASEIQAEPQAYAKLIEGEMALQTGDIRSAIKSFTDANGLLDTWIGHFDLGRAYLTGKQYPQADSEFDRCLKRRGEALALFLDEEPTFGVLPPVYYYQGLAREGMQTTGFAESYRAYLRVRGASSEDPMAADASRRASVNP